jgi:hypothetical protein
MPISIESITKRIEDARKKSENDFLGVDELVKLCSKQELSSLLTSDETAKVLTAMAGRNISMDYVKLLRRKDRLPVGRQVTERAYLYRLQDILFVTFNKKRVSDKSTCNA